MRNKRIDLLRVIAIFFIVWLHSATDKVFPSAVMQISAVPVHIFFFLAGYFCFGKTDKQLWKRILHFFALYVLSNVFYLIVCCIITKSTPISYLKGLYNSQGFKKFFLNFFAFNTFLPSQLGGHLWYLSAFIVAMIALIIVRRKFLLPISITLYLIGVVLSRIIFPIKNITVSAYCLRNGIFEAVPMVFLGYYLNSIKDKTQRIYQRKALFFSVSAIILIVSYIILTVIYKKFNVCTDLAILNVVIALTLFFLFAYPAKERDNNVALNLFAFIGAKLTLYIYIIHPLFIVVFLKVLSKFMVTLFAFLASLAVSYLYYELKIKFKDLLNKKKQTVCSQEKLSEENEEKNTNEQ